MRDAERFTLFGARGTGAVAVEAALTLLGAPYTLIEADPFGDPTEQQRAREANPLMQVPVLQLASGERLSESAAILIWLADSHPDAGLAPPAGDPRRAAFLRWMVYIPANIYPMYTLKDRPERWFDDPPSQRRLVEHAIDRIRTMWRVMDEAVIPAPYILGERLSVLDVYTAVVSRWSPRRRQFRADCPRLGAAVERVDAEPRLQELWAERFPFGPGWDVMP